MRTPRARLRRWRYSRKMERAFWRAASVATAKWRAGEDFSPWVRLVEELEHLPDEDLAAL